MLCGRGDGSEAARFILHGMDRYTKVLTQGPLFGEKSGLCCVLFGYRSIFKSF